MRSAALLARVGPACKLLHRFTEAKTAPVTVGGLTFPNRVGIAGGLDKNGVAVRAWWAFGFGFVELGTVTPRPQAGNDKPRMFRLPAERAVRNRMGFNNHGAEALAKRLVGEWHRRPPFPIGVSLGKNKDTLEGAAADDYAKAATFANPVADFVTINVSSPNTAGLRNFQDPETLRPLIRAVKSVIGRKSLYVKLAPELTGKPLADVVAACLEEGCVGLIATNTWATFDDRTGQPLGGLSGGPLKAIAPQRVAEIRKLLGDGPALIGCGGIDDIASARRMRDAGADLIQLYTGLVYRGPFLGAHLARAIA